ncbi:MAG: type II secretion system protein [Parcubacteria group bacterium]|nr:type II secretion system protein [Parcubacteria group bacterium]
MEKLLETPLTEERAPRAAGMTLIELIVAIGIFVLVIGAMAGFYVQAVRGERRERAQQIAVENGREILEAIADELKNAEAIHVADRQCANSHPDGAGECVIFVNSARRSQFYPRRTIKIFARDGVLYRNEGENDKAMSSAGVESIHFDIPSISSPRLTVLIRFMAYNQTVDIQRTLIPRSF